MGTDKLHKVWEISIKGKTLFLKRYGNFCFWEKIVLEKDSKEVYRIKYESRFKNDENIGIRKEFFFNKFFREYSGNQFSFIEYLERMNKEQNFPNRNELIKKGLEKKFAERYNKYAKRIFNQ